MTSGSLGSVSHTGLSVDDLDRSLEFYGEAFGAELLFREGLAEEIARTVAIPGMRCDLAELRLPGDDHVIELIEFEAPAGQEGEIPTAVGHGHICIRVDELAPALERVEKAGASRIGEVVTFPEGGAVYLREPGGSVLELSEIDPDQVT